MNFLIMNFKINDRVKYIPNDNSSKNWVEFAKTKNSYGRIVALNGIHLQVEFDGNIPNFGN